MVNEKSLTDNFTEYDIVEVFNPLKDDFVGQIATEVINPAIRVDKNIEKLGIRNKSHPSKEHVINHVTVPAGKSVKMPGHVARVIVTQLSRKIMQLEGQQKMMGDKALSRQFEERIVLNSEKFNKDEDVMTTEERFQRQLNDLNKEIEATKEHDEKPFADREEAKPVTSSSATIRNNPITVQAPKSK